MFLRAFLMETICVINELCLEQIISY